MNHLYPFTSVVSRENCFICIAFGEMKAAVLLSNSWLVAVVLLFFGWGVDESLPCDTKWIRLVYMLSCGKKKRESVWKQNDTFFENLPSDFEGAFKYYKEKDPFNPLFNDASFYKILEEDDENPRMENSFPKLLIFEEDENFQQVPRTTATPRSSSVLMKKLFPKAANGNHLGIPGFPEQWDVQEIVDEKINENHRREINRLIEECCKVPPVISCNGNTFSGAC